MNRAISILFFIVFPAALACAFTFEPITAEFDPTGPGSMRTFTLENNDTSPIAVRIMIRKRIMNEDGSDTLLEADNDFQVFPSNIALRSKGTQVIRVQWKGTATPEKEYAYRIIAEQLPVDFSRTRREGGVINVQFRYIGSLYVVPGPQKPEVALKSIEKISGESGEKKLVIVLENVSGVHTLLRDLQLTLVVKNSEGEAVQTLTLAGDSLDGMSGQNILAGSIRRFAITSPPNLADGTLHATFRYQIQ